MFPLISSDLSQVEKLKQSPKLLQSSVLPLFPAVGQILKIKTKRVGSTVF